MKINKLVTMSIIVLLASCASMQSDNNTASKCYIETKTKAVQMLFKHAERFKERSNSRKKIFSVLDKSGGIKEAMSIIRNNTADNDNGTFQKAWFSLASTTPQFLQSQFDAIKYAGTNKNLKSIFPILIGNGSFSYSNFLNATSNSCK